MKENREVIERACLSCGAPIQLAATDLVVGQHVRCLHCNAEAQVVQEWDAQRGQHHWALDETDEELPPERV